MCLFYDHLVGLLCDIKEAITLPPYHDHTKRLEDLPIGPLLIQRLQTPTHVPPIVCQTPIQKAPRFATDDLFGADTGNLTRTGDYITQISVCAVECDTYKAMLLERG
jgi:hypothetical protein